MILKIYDSQNLILLSLLAKWFRLYRIALLTCLFFIPICATGQNSGKEEDGYRTWLRYHVIGDQQLLKNYKTQLSTVVLNENSETMRAVKSEITRGLEGLLDQSVLFEKSAKNDGVLIIGTPANQPLLRKWDDELQELGDEGFLIKNAQIKGFDALVIAANSDIGLLYGTFHLLRLMQIHQKIENISITSKPKMKLRMSNHWDNADRSVERGYAGLSLWEWSTLPEYIHPRYIDFARICASVGINGVAINNVNADSQFLNPNFIEKIAALAKVFRPYGINVYMSINYSSPISLGGLSTADPLNAEVVNWWKKKADEIYLHIPDFGGFLVKADSEGQPGPKIYGRTHDQGANMLAQVLKPKGGIVIWRAFVYDAKQTDRVREAYDEFISLDGKFEDNVILQIKNGPLDFMPREPFSPLFGGLPKTNKMIEFQVTQEYLGNGNHLVYKGSMFKEVLDSKTYAYEEGATVGEILEGKDNSLTGMAAVINPGTDRNWTGHPFVQSSWYAYGRLSWDYTLNDDQIAEEWIRMTFSNNVKTIGIIKNIMQESAKAAVNFREPLGLTHIGNGIHYGPAPWSSRSKSFHCADHSGIGFDRTLKGSKAVEQYNEPLRMVLNDISQIPEKYLLWFHHVSWNHQMKSGRSLWDELVYQYYEGVQSVQQMQRDWNSLEGKIDPLRFSHVKSLLKIQERDAIQWRNSCVLYFQTFSGMPIPEDLEKPEHDLEYYKNLKYNRFFP